MCFIYSHPASHLPPSFPLRTAWCRWTALRTLSDWPKKNIPKKEAERRKEDDDMNAERNRGCWATLTDTDLYNTNIWVFFHLSCRTKLKHLLTDVIFIPLLVSEFVKCVIQLTHFVTSCFLFSTFSFKGRSFALIALTSDFLIVCSAQVEFWAHSILLINFCGEQIHSQVTVTVSFWGRLSKNTSPLFSLWKRWRYVGDMIEEYTDFWFHMGQEQVSPGWKSIYELQTSSYLDVFFLGIWTHLFKTEHSGKDGPKTGTWNWTDNLKVTGLVVKQKILMCFRLNWPVLQVEIHFVERCFFCFYG